MSPQEMLDKLDELDIRLAENDNDLEQAERFVEEIKIQRQKLNMKVYDLHSKLSKALSPRLSRERKREVLREVRENRREMTEDEIYNWLVHKRDWLKNKRDETK